ncbi:hypothetical protein ACJW30_05G214600 [Castanea mollissima]
MSLLEIKEEFVRSNPTNMTIGDHLLPSWVDEPDSECCEWERIICSSTTGHVSHLFLHNIRNLNTDHYHDSHYYYHKDVVWFLNTSLFETFMELNNLDLSLNWIGGWVENEGSESLLRLNKLERLDLGRNLFNQNIIQSLRLLKSLKTLSLAANLLEGSFPAKGISIFEDLEMLDLRYNRLNGSLTVQGPFPGWLLENNPRLEFVTLNNNFFTGHFHLRLPLNSAYAMDVSNNQLSGQLQGNMGNILPKIRLLNLSKNAFEGYLPFSIGNMSLLDQLNLSFNNFSGEVPKELHTGCFQLQILDLSNNKFSGHLLSITFNFTKLRVLKINDNQFSGTLSPKCSLMSYFDVSNNKMSDKIPTWICNNTNIDTLFLRNNFFKGQIPCETIQIRHLDLSQNSLSGSLPSWSSERLEQLHLGQNNFSGSIPEAFFNISRIWTLDISDNRLSGKVPNAIGELWGLRILLLRGNRLSGEIPTQLCQMEYINLMDLSNNFLSGMIPHCFHRISFDPINIFGAYYSVLFSTTPYQYRIFQKVIDVPFLGLCNYFKASSEIGLGYLYAPPDEFNFVTKYRLSSYKGHVLDYMSGLDFSCTNLTGGIPLELGQLSRIHALNLSHNQLIGSIPETLSKMTELESLDLCHNCLNGEIPPQLIEPHFLEVFSVAHNNLSGRTPDMKAQFGTFSARSYEFNPFLCGLPLQKNCTSKDDSPPMPTKSSDVNDGKWYKVDQTIFFISFSVTYFMFFLGVIIVLYINPHWQLRCFNLVEDCMYSCYFSVVITLRKVAVRLYN